MTKANVATLVDFLKEKPQTFLSDPIVLSEEQIEREIANREHLDRSMQDDRQHAIDELFPQRIEGSLRGAVQTFDTPFDF